MPVSGLQIPMGGIAAAGSASANTIERIDRSAREDHAQYGRIIWCRYADAADQFADRWVLYANGETYSSLGVGIQPPGGTNRRGASAIGCACYDPRCGEWFHRCGNCTGAFAWFGYALAGVPHALSFGLATCLFSIIPGGPMLLALPAIGWLYQQGSVGWAIFVAVWTLFAVGSIDNVVKTLVIGRSSPLPIVLILFGVAGVP